MAQLNNYEHNDGAKHFKLYPRNVIHAKPVIMFVPKRRQEKTTTICNIFTTENNKTLLTSSFDPVTMYSQAQRDNPWAKFALYCWIIIFSLVLLHFMITGLGCPTSKGWLRGGGVHTVPQILYLQASLQGTLTFQYTNKSISPTMSNV
jgi:hypothetical protein